MKICIYCYTPDKFIEKMYFGIFLGNGKKLGVRTQRRRHYASSIKHKSVCLTPNRRDISDPGAVTYTPQNQFKRMPRLGNEE